MNRRGNEGMRWEWERERREGGSCRVVPPLCPSTSNNFESCLASPRIQNTNNFVVRAISSDCSYNSSERTERGGESRECGLKGANVYTFTLMLRFPCLSPLHLYNLFRKLSDHIINCLQHQFVPAPHEAVWCLHWVKRANIRIHMASLSQLMEIISCAFFLG